MCCSSKTRHCRPRSGLPTSVPSSGSAGITDTTPLIADHASTVSGSPPSYHAATKLEVPPYPAHAINEKVNKQDKQDKKDKKDRTAATFPTALTAIPEGSVEFNNGFAVVTASNGEVYRLEMSKLSQQEIDCLEHGHQRRRKFGWLGITGAVVFFPGGLIWMFCDSYVQCSHCQTVLSTKHCCFHRKRKDAQVEITKSAQTQAV